MHRKLPHLGDYVPGRTNYLLLAVQVLFAVQGAARGMDYVLPRPDMPTPASLSSIEEALPLPVWGWGYLLAGGLILCGLYGGWLTSIVIGHALLAGLYGAFSYGLFEEAPIYSYWMSSLGITVLMVGIWFGINRWKNHEVVRFALAMLFTAVGGWTAGIGLGYNFRTATGLLIAGTAHAAFVVGTLFVTSRVAPHPEERRGR